ncbi:MAG: type IV toxin-antitoxin system AbiEi family antitoxin domain-containing protein [bacterium]
MRPQELKRIKRLYFGYEAIAKALGISRPSAKVTANRYVRHGLLVRVKKNMYVLKEKWDTVGTEERFIIANLAQVPSYISLMTALDYHEITTQVQRDLFESVAVKRTKEISFDRAVFWYTRINADLYFGFVKQKGFFMATAEKAFLDAIYLMSLGRYDLDLSSMDIGKLNMDHVKRMSRQFPLKTQKALERHGYLGRA